MPRDSIIDWSTVSNPQLPGDAAPAPCLSCQTAGSGYATRADAMPWEERLWAGVVSAGATRADGLVQHGALPARMPWENEARVERDIHGASNPDNLGNYVEIATCYETLGDYVGTGTVARYPIVLGPDTGDFDPGFPADPTEMSASGVCPSGCRILLAVSADGKTWHKTGLVVMDSGAVPALAVEGDKLFLFCNAVGTGDDGKPTFDLVMAWTEDLVHWKYNKPARYGIDLIPTSANYMFVGADWMDPSVVRKADGDGWYLFTTLRRHDYIGGTTVDGGNTFVAKADSLLDKNWTIVNSGNPVYPDITLAGQPQSAYGTTVPYEVDDPSVLYMHLRTSYYEYFAAPINSSYISGVVNLRLTFDATDNVTVTTMPSLVRSVSVDGRSVDAHMSNGLETPDGDYKWFAFGQEGTGTPDARIFSYSWSRLHRAWMLNDPLPLLSVDQTYESYYVQDAAVVHYRNCYVMAYTTQIP